MDPSTGQKKDPETMEHEEEGQPLGADSRYTFDPARLQKLCDEKPWTKDPTYLRKVALSPSAVMKMMMHCNSGVEKGVSKGGNPIEVMGLLLGRPDPDNPKTLIVTDAFPLPIEGFETRVIADDQNVVNHMISLNECLERSRKEKFMGWYHSHPFDLGDNSHCFLSQTDLSTQLQWQRAEDPHGNPFVAIVVDPIRSLHTATPELKAFRAYPPEYSPPADTCPDMSIEIRERVRLEHWGSCWNRYYELGVEYFMSSTSRTVMEQLTRNYIWMRTLQQPKEFVEQQKIKNITAAVGDLKSASAAMGETSVDTSADRQWSVQRDPTSAASGVVIGKGDGSNSLTVKRTKAMEGAVDKVADLASAELAQSMLTATKQKIFQ